jgi:hypothetical protein
VSEKKKPVGRPRIISGGAQKINIYMSKEDIDDMKQMQIDFGFTSLSETFRFIRNCFVKDLLPTFDTEAIKDHNDLKF